MANAKLALVYWGQLQIIIGTVVASVLQSKTENLLNNKSVRTL